ncbi:hypothetical protein pEaSNUABM37_00219 [Erwinia phage pEa_SNUABM_37]|nr:hypothetical protein pEaSNUABM37_00219 [Erwinia phage pEa_SNUABM_37]QXO10689.1 hypothetical protein pEaSNUABM48_00219 [Erwinia phage pEa_SNUABM_48]
MSCTQLVVIEQPKEESQTPNMSLRSPYSTLEERKMNVVLPMAIGLAQLAQLVYGKQ